MADDKDIAGDDGGGGKKKLLIIIIAVVVLLLGGGAAAYFVLAGGDEEAVAEADAKDVEEAPAPVNDGPAIYHSMKPTYVVNLPPGGPVKMLQVAVEVLTYSPEVDAFLTTHDPMLRHHLTNLFEEQTAAELLTREGKLALQGKVQDLLTEHMKQMRQAGEIKGVYFTQFVLQ